MAWSASSLGLAIVVLLVLFAHPAHAFGAGNIASTARIEGQNWRHGDIEDTLLTLLISRAAGGKKFSKLDVQRVYFGNWLRDYSQAVDVGTVKYVSAEAIRMILWVLGFMSFGYGTKEFEVTTERLGCYRPEEHIDNPKDYADNEDARQYDHRLRGPVDNRRELSVDPQTGLKNYIASEQLGITTSAGLVRNLFGRSIQLGRQYARSRNHADLYEALRLLGTGCHCLEDFSAHSNYTELALIELGERGVFPHVGRQTQIQLRGARQAVYPIVTGTFGGVDFLHSVMGEFSDKATQSEIQELQGTIEQSQNTGQNTSILQDLLSKVPSGIFGGKDQAGKVDELQSNATAAQMQHTKITPRRPEEWTRYLTDVQKQIYPILEWHDEIMQSITETIEKIPILPDLIEQLQDEINIFVFSLLAPFILPVINQVKTELATGSSEIIQSSGDKQLIVFRDDRSSDPTHSMLSKDHFSNILNEPAGKVASQILKWVVPQLIQCWDDERIDVNRTLSRIVTGVLHHPTLREYGDDGARDGRQLMFGVIQRWWGQKDERERAEMRGQLSREGVESGRNHKDGVVDTGHGSCKPLGMPRAAGPSSGGIGGGAAAGVLGAMSGLMGEFEGGSSGSAGGFGAPQGSSSGGGLGELTGGVIGGGALGGIVGGLVGGVGSDLLGGAFGGKEDKTQAYQKQSHGRDGSYTQTFTETGYSPAGARQSYGQAQYSRTEEVGGGRREEYQRYQQGGSGTAGYGEQVIQETRPTYSGGYEQTTETRYEAGGRWQSDVRQEERTPGGEYRTHTQHYGGEYNNSGSEDEFGNKKHHKKHHKNCGSRSNSGEEGIAGRYGGRQQESRFEENRYQQEQQTSGYGRQTAYQEEEREECFGRTGRYGQQQRQYGRGPGEFGQQQKQYGRAPGGYEQEYEQPNRGGYGGGGYEQESREGYGGGGYEREQEERSGGGGFFRGRREGEEEYQEREKEERYEQREEYGRRDDGEDEGGW